MQLSVQQNDYCKPRSTRLNVQSSSTLLELWSLSYRVFFLAFAICVCVSGATCIVSLFSVMNDATEQS